MDDKDGITLAIVGKDDGKLDVVGGFFLWIGLFPISFWYFLRLRIFAYRFSARFFLSRVVDRHYFLQVG